MTKSHEISDVKLQEVLGWKPHPNQEKVLACGAREIAISAGSRFGKSALCGYIALKELLKPNRKIWIVAPTYDLTGKVFEYIARWYMKVHPSQSERISYRPIPQIRDLNGSFVQGKSAENPAGLLGEEVDLMIVDEAARLDRNIWNSYLMMRTASRKGRTIFISTPYGRNWFFEQWVSAKAAGGAFQFTSKDGVSVDEVEWERLRLNMPEQVFKQECMAEFLEDAASVFRRVSEIVDPKCLEDVKPDRRYVCGADLGRINDFTVLTVLDIYSHKVVAWERFREISWPLQKARIKALSQRYNKARIIMDSTGLGDPISEDLRQDGYMVDDYKLSKKSKQQLIEKLSLFIEQRAIAIPKNEILIDELLCYSYDLGEKGNWSYSAPSGKHDDAVISLALAVWGLQDTRVAVADRITTFFGEKKKPIEYPYR